MERLLTAKELADVLGTPRLNSIYDLAASGELPSLKVPGVGRRFRESEVSTWLESCRATPKGVQTNVKQASRPGRRLTEAL